MFTNLPCLKCTETGCVLLDLADGEFSCRHCENTWTQDDVRDLMAQWESVLKWITQAYECEEVAAN